MRAASGGSAAVVIPYRVPAANSGYLVNVDGRELEAAVTGEITPATGTGKPVLAGFTLRAMDLPENFPARAVNEEMVFVEGLRLSGESAKAQSGPAHSLSGVPVLGRQAMTERNGDEYRNEIVYTHCREFRGESSIRFEDAPSQRGTVAAGGERLTVSTWPVPRGVPIDAELATRLDWNTLRTGDAVDSLVTRDARFKGSTVLPERARLRGFAAMVHGENARFQLMERTAPRGGPLLQGGFFQTLGPQLDVPKGFEIRWVTVEVDR